MLHLTDNVGKKLTPYVSLQILQTVCHTILMTLLRRMWCQLDQPITPQLIVLFILITCVPEVVSIL